MISNIADGVWKINANSNIYIVKKNDIYIAIDAGDPQYKSQVLSDIKTITDPKNISKVYLTHLHYDHIGNIDLFPDAEIYAHKDEIESYKDDQFGTILAEDLIEKYHITLNPFPENFEFELIHSPGHTKGSICLYDPKEKILFSGDTLFFNHGMGRIDLPSSIPERMESSLNNLDNYEIVLLCPGHDY